MDAPIWSSMKGQGTSLANILRTSSTNVLRTLKYDVLRTSWCDVLRMTPYSPICMSWDVPYWCVEDVSCRRYEDVLCGLIFTSKGRVLQTSWGRPSEASLYGSISKDKKHQEIRTSAYALSINKMASAGQQVDHKKEGIWITCLKLNNKTYIFLSSKILSNSIYDLATFCKWFSEESKGRKQ